MLSPEYIGKRRPLRLDISADSPAIRLSKPPPLTLHYDSVQFPIKSHYLLFKKEDDFNVPESSSKAKSESSE